MKKIIFITLLTSGICCYGQSSYSALVVCDSLHNRISIETDSTFTITKDKSKVHIYGDTMACIILMAQEIQRLSDDMRREKRKFLLYEKQIAVKSFRIGYRNGILCKTWDDGPSLRYFVDKIDTIQINKFLYEQDGY